jgi:ferredoxin
MAVFTNRYPDNVLGRFYVDDQCIDCDLCRETAPNNFTRNEDGGYSYVFNQPTSPEEETLCKEAMEGCPVEAIGNDGTQARPAVDDVEVAPAEPSPQQTT